VTAGKPNRRISHILHLPNRYSQRTVVAEVVWYQSQRYWCNELKTGAKCYKTQMCLIRLNKPLNFDKAQLRNLVPTIPITITP
jgi:hypothetical protein